MAADPVTPEQLSRGRMVPDDELPGVAAVWLAEGYDSPTLRDLAGLTRHDKMEAGRLLPQALAELGQPVTEPDPASGRDLWSDITWAVAQVDRTYSPFAAAQYVLGVLVDAPELWEAAHGDRLAELHDAWDRSPADHDATAESLRGVLRSLGRTPAPRP